MEQQSNSSLRRLIVEIFGSHTDTHIRYDSSEWVISPSQRPLPTQHTTNTKDENPCIQRDSNPRYQQAYALHHTTTGSGVPFITTHFYLLTRPTSNNRMVSDTVHEDTNRLFFVVSQTAVRKQST